MKMGAEHFGTMIRGETKICWGKEKGNKRGKETKKWKDKKSKKKEEKNKNRKVI